MYRYLVCVLLVFIKVVPCTYAQTVTLDTYFNHETRQTKEGVKRFHYLWTDDRDSGFSIWGAIFKANGFTLDTLDEVPTLKNLHNSNVYIIVDPDSKKETTKPNFIETKAIEQIALWVKSGGVLVMMANDSANVELLHFNDLAGKFGLHFNNDLQNHVIDDKHFKDGEASAVDRSVFASNPKVFLKDVCSISLNNKEAKGVITSADGSAAIAAIVKYGKGTVFAVGDPWLYNEYVNGRLPTIYQNDIAAKDLTRWLKDQINK
jgi:hypothetical protein